MAIEKVKEYFSRFGMDGQIREFEVSSATVELAALALDTSDSGSIRQRRGIGGDPGTLQAATGEGIHLQRFFDEDLHQELCVTLVNCIRNFRI